MSAEEYYDDEFEWGFPPKPVQQHVWVTKDNRRINIDEMSADHIRNALKLIMRYAHEGKVWALKPATGGLRHYTKDQIVASVTVKKAPPVPTSTFDGVTEITLKLDVEETKALIALTGRTEGGTVGGAAAARVYFELVDKGFSAEGQKIVGVNDNSAIKFGR